MKTLQFQISINASRGKVWSTLWNDDTYRKWTSVFSDGSHAQSNWEQGERILFLDAKGNGLFSLIENKIPNELMSFKHLGIVKDGAEQPFDEESKAWSGSKEEYRLKETSNKTELLVNVDVVAGFETHFGESFPKGLQIIKELAEK